MILNYSIQDLYTQHAIGLEEHLNTFEYLTLHQYGSDQSLFDLLLVSLISLTSILISTLDFDKMKDDKASS